MYVLGTRHNTNMRIGRRDAIRRWHPLGVLFASLSTLFSNGTEQLDCRVDCTDVSCGVLESFVAGVVSMLATSLRQEYTGFPPERRLAMDQRSSWDECFSLCDMLQYLLFRFSRRPGTLGPRTTLRFLAGPYGRVFCAPFGVGEEIH